MKISDVVYKECDTCGRRNELIADAKYVCDNCASGVLELDDLLESTVFYDDERDCTRIQCCSWKCMLEKLRVVDTNYFISLPRLQMGDAPPGTSAEDFFALLKIS